MGVHWNLPFGIKETKFVLEKVRKRFSHWANRILRMQERLALLKHVLRVIPVFHLMAFKLLKNGFIRQVEDLCQEFLWGKNDEGKAKIPLVAQETITQRNKLGGLAIQTFQ